MQSPPVLALTTIFSPLNSHCWPKEVEGVNEFRGDLVEDACGKVVVAEELLIAFEGASAECGAGFEVQGVLDVRSEDVGFDGLLSVPVEEVSEEDEARHRIEFFGVSAEGFAEVLGKVIDGHDLKDDMAKDSLPAVADDLASRRWNDPFEGVEEAVLSGVDGMDHGGRNSFSKIRLSIEERPRESRGKMAIK